MLNGLDPIIIFQFKKLLPDFFDVGTKIPVVASETKSSFPLPFIPIYLSERLTGLYIESENKSIEIDTTIDTVSDGSDPNINQRGITSTVKIEMLARSSSLGISLISALSDLVFPKVTSKEYSITYLHGAVTVFNGLLHSFSITQESNTDLYRISMELIKPGALPKLPIPVVAKTSGVTLGG